MVESPSVGPRRRVYFLSGFDPRGSAHYYRLFSEQLRRYGRRGGRTLQLGRRRSQADGLLSRWTISEQGAAAVELVFLHWDDIAREHWPRQPWRLLWDGLIFSFWYLLQGGLLRIARMSPSVALCGAYPLMFALLAAGVALFGGAAADRWLQTAGVAPSLAIGVALALGALLLWQAWRLAERLGVVWLFRSIRFTHQLGQARDQALRDRVQALALRVAALEQQAPAAELLLVGHSSGSFVLAMLAAELQRLPAWPQLLPRLRLLSLGQNLANLAVHRGAERFHQDLIALASEPRPPWLDVTSRDDYLCFAGVDPYRSCSLPPPPGGAYPELRLIDLAGPRGIRNWWQLMACQFDLHFDYLRSRDVPAGAFDCWQLMLEGTADA